MTSLFVARWPGGTVTVLSAETAEHAADPLDQVGEAGQCEVTPLAGELWLTFEPSADANRIELPRSPAGRADGLGDELANAAGRAVDVARLAVPSRRRALSSVELKLPVA